MRTVPERHLRRRAEGRLRHPRVLPARAQGGPTVHLPREPVPLVARDRGGAAGQAREPAPPGLPGRARPAGEAQHRLRRHARHARRADRGGRRRRTRPRLHALRAVREARRPRLHPREDRDRRRRVAHARLGEPQRALALQRHRDERRHPRPGARARNAAAASGRSISSCRPRRSRTILCARWTSSGNRSARSSSTGAPPACRSPTGSCGSSTSLAARAAFSARCPASSSTAELGPR